MLSIWSWTFLNKDRPTQLIPTLFPIQRCMSFSRSRWKPCSWKEINGLFANAKISNLSNSPVIPRDEVPDSSILERHVLAPIDVSYTRAGRIHHSSMALPDLEAQLVLLSSPNVQASKCQLFHLLLIWFDLTFIIPSQFPEPLLRDREVSTGHHRGREGMSGVGTVLEKYTWEIDNYHDTTFFVRGRRL